MSQVSAGFEIATGANRLVVHDMGGSDDSPLLLLCHATGFCAYAYKRLADELIGSFHVLAPDFRGHGETPAPADRDFDWRRYRDELLAVSDFAASELGQEHPYGFGHSMGGAVLLLAELAQPGLLRAGYLFEPVVLPTAVEGPSTPLAEAARRRRATFPSRAAALARYASRPPLDLLQAGVLADYVEHGFSDTAEGEVLLRCAPADEADTYDASGKPLIAEIGAIVPPLVIGAGNLDDGGGPASWAGDVAAALSAGRLERHEQLGHFGPLEDPRGIGAAVLAAFAELAP